MSVAALSIGAAFAGEDSTHRFHSTGPEWHELTSAAVFRDADSLPEAIAEPTSVVVLERHDYPLERYDYPG